MRGARGFRGPADNRPGRHTAAAIADETTAGVFDTARKALLDSASAGNLRAIELLARGALESLSPAAPGSAEAVEQHIAEAAIAAACLASELGPEATAAWLDTFPELPMLQVLPKSVLGGQPQS